MADDFTFIFQGEALTATIAGALYWPRERMLIVSDLHFEKGSSFARKGVMLPPYDTRATLMAIEALCAHYRPEKILSLGDSFHDGKAEGRIHKEDAMLLETLTREFSWTWILGNHDPAPPARFGGKALEELILEPFCFRHEALQNPQTGEISGHYHPVARIHAEGRHLRRRCFIYDQKRLIMPAMGAFTGGLNILDSAIADFFQPQVQILAMGDKRVFPVSMKYLVADQKRNQWGQSQVKKKLSASHKAG